MGKRLKPLTPQRKLKRLRRRTNSGSPTNQEEQLTPTGPANSEPIKPKVTPTTPIPLETSYQCPFCPKGGCDLFEKINPLTQIAQELVDKGFTEICSHWDPKGCLIGALNHQSSKSVIFG